MPGASFRDEFIRTHDLYATGQEIEMSRDDNGLMLARLVPPPPPPAVTATPTGDMQFGTVGDIIPDIPRAAAAAIPGTAAGGIRGVAELVSLIGGSVEGAYDAYKANDGEKLDAYLKQLSEHSKMYGGEKVKGMMNSLLDVMGVPEQDKEQFNLAADVGEVYGIGEGILKAPGAVIKGLRKLDEAGQAAQARIDADTGMTLTSGVDPTKAADELLAAAGKAARVATGSATPSKVSDLSTPEAIVSYIIDPSKSTGVPREDLIAKLITDPSVKTRTMASLNNLGYGEGSTVPIFRVMNTAPDSMKSETFISGTLRPEKVPDNVKFMTFGKYDMFGNTDYMLVRYDVPIEKIEAYFPALSGDIKQTVNTAVKERGFGQRTGGSRVIKPVTNPAKHAKMLIDLQDEIIADVSGLEPVILKHPNGKYLNPMSHENEWIGVASGTTKNASEFADDMPSSHSFTDRRNPEGLTSEQWHAAEAEAGRNAFEYFKDFFRPARGNAPTDNAAQTVLPKAEVDTTQLRQVLEIKAAEMAKKEADRLQPSGKDPLFDTSPESYKSNLPEQKETPVPRAPAGAKLPLDSRAQIIVDRMDDIADVLAERIRPHLGSSVQYFYHTGPLIDKAVELGIPLDEARERLRKFSLNYAATSPRTQTEPNLRSASLVGAKETHGIKYDEIVGPGGTGINESGYPMMINPARKGGAAGLHKLLLDALAADGINYKTNPKPYTFAENVAGNLSGVTVDTHAIRGAIDALNELEPGSIPLKWIKDKNKKGVKVDWREQYQKDPSKFDPATWVDDTLSGQVVDGEKIQTEYAVFSDLYKAVAQRLGISPAEAQALAWFVGGEKTGLASAPKTIVDIIEDRVDVTAQALNRSKADVFVDFFKGKIPLLSVGGMTLLETGTSMDETNGEF